MDETRPVRRTDNGVLVLDNPKALRAIAHPARSLALDRLFEGDPMTATELAAEAGITPSAMSYHLRALAAWGLVERVEDGEDARNRPWRAAGSRLELRPGNPGSRSADVTQAFMGRYLRRLWERVEKVTVWRGVDGRDAHMGYSVLYLTQDERRRVVDAIEAALNDPGFADRTPQNHPSDAHRYEAWSIVLPDDAGAPGAEPATG